MSDKTVFQESPVKQGEENASSPCGKPKKRHSRGALVCRVILWTLFGVLLLVVAAGCCLTWWLTPERLTPLVNTQLSRILDADVTTHNVRFTFWSTFPHLHVEIDSMRVESRALDSLPASEKRRLPANARFLMSSGRFEGGINMRALMRKRYLFRNVRVDSLKLNLVQALDSLGNWDIVPPGLRGGIPYFSFNEITVTRPQKLTYTSVPLGLTSSADIRSFALRGTDVKDDYEVNLGGVSSISMGRDAILSGFPFSFGGRISLKFHPFGLRTDNYAVSLGNTRGHVSVNLEIEHTPVLRTFEYAVEAFNLNKLLSFLPVDRRSGLKDIDARIDISGVATLENPYVFGSRGYPTSTISLTIPHGSVRYDSRHYGSYSLNDVTMRCKLKFNGKEPKKSVFYVPELKLRDDGTEVLVQGQVSGFDRDPEIRLRASGRASLESLGRMFRSLRVPGLKGDMNSSLALTFRLSDIRNVDLSRVKLTGDADITGLSLSELPGGGSVSASEMKVRFLGDADKLTGHAVNGTLLDADLDINGLSGSASGFRFRGNDINISSRAADKGRAGLDNVLRHLPYDMNFSVGSFNLVQPKDTLAVTLKNTKGTGRIHTVLRHGVRARGFSFSVNGRNLRVNHNRTTFSLDNVSTSLFGVHLEKPLQVRNNVPPAEWLADTVGAKGLRSTPRLLRVTIPRRLRDFLTSWRAALKLVGRGGTLLTPAFPVVNHLTGVAIDADIDSVLVHRMEVRSQRSSGFISGSVSNVRQFLLSRTPAPLKLRFFAEFDTVQLNQIAGAYRYGMGLTKGADAFQKMVNDTTMTANDSTAPLIPRNLDIKTGLSFRQVQYTDIRYNDCKGELQALNGNLRLDNVSVNTDFVRFAGNLRYNSSDIRNLAFRLHLDMNRLNVTQFFYYFHTLSLMMPQLTNVSGMLDIGTDFSMNIFPTMYAVMPSVYADVRLRGRNVMLKQTPLIHKYARLVLHNDDTIQIGDIAIHARMLDNMVRVYPFDIDVAHFRLRAQGLNSLNGNMYYHIGVHRWLLPIPFGINIKGTFRKPEIRTGGVSWHDSYGTSVANHVMNGIEMNVMNKTKRIIHEFIEKAAEADTTRASDYVTFH